MTSEALIGAACGIGIGLLVGIVCCIIFFYLKRSRQNAKLYNHKTRKKSFPPPGPTILQPQIPSFIIPNTIPLRIQTPSTREVNPLALSPPALEELRSSNSGSRRGSVALDEILTSVSMMETPPRKASPQSFSSANEPAIASLYNQQKKAIGKKNQLKKSQTSSALGKLEFSLFYDQNLQELQIYIVRGIQTYVPEKDGTANVVIKAVVLFDRKEVWQDKTQPTEASSEPDFSEQLVVHGLPVKNMRKGTLKLIVMDNDTGQFGGEVVYPLSSLPFNIFTNETIKLTEVETEDFKDDKQDGDNLKKGELLISMCHNRNEKTLTVGIESAKGLPIMYRGTIDSFVKVDIMYVGKKLHSRTTKVVNKNRNPDYEDETFHFIIPDDKMPQTTVVFKVKHRGKMSDKPVGIVKLGYDADREMEYRHLEQVLDKPHLSIANWHVIRKYR